MDALVASRGNRSYGFRRCTGHASPRGDDAASDGASTRWIPGDNCGDLVVCEGSPGPVRRRHGSHKRHRSRSAYCPSAVQFGTDLTYIHLLYAMLRTISRDFHSTLLFIQACITRAALWCRAPPSLRLYPSSHLRPCLLTPAHGHLDRTIYLYGRCRRPLHRPFIG